MTKEEKEVLVLLREDARLSVPEMAVQLQLSEKEVAKAISNLEKERVILGYHVVVDDEKSKDVRRTVRALIEVCVRPEKKTGFDAIAKRICRYSNVVDHYLISGQYDFLVVVEGTSLQEISGFVSDKLASIDAVKSTVTHFIMRKYKENGVLHHDDSEYDRLKVSL